MYKISEFSKMVGLPPSKVRFYEKGGLLKPKIDTNGYHYFTHTDAFRVNAFRVLLQYGFTVEKAVEMLDEMQSGDLFVDSLKNQKEELEKQIDLMNNRLKRLNRVISLLQEGDNYTHKFEVIEMEEYLYVHASNGVDFSISVTNADVIALFAELLSITSYARIIKKEDLLRKNKNVYPSYTCVIPASKESSLGNYDKSKVKRLQPGKCIRFYRKKTREESAKWDSFYELFLFMTENNYTIRNDILLLPTFLNLDEFGSDIEVLYVPIH